MKQNLQISLMALLLTLSLGFGKSLMAQTVRTSAQSGLFSDGTTWVGGAAPADYDDIIIASGHTVTLDVAPVVFNITIQNGATLDNATYSLTIGSVNVGSPIYNNDGIHNGSGHLIAYDFFRTGLSGNGITNCTIEIRSYGLYVPNTCHLTINGNIQHASSGNNGMNGKILIEAWSPGATLTINGDIMTNSVYGGVGIENMAATIVVNGNVSLPGSSSNGASATITNGADATFNISGNLILGAYSSYCQNYGSMVIGGNLTGAFDTYFIQEANSTVKFGGSVFPDDDGYLFGVESPVMGSSEPNTIEFNGTSAQNIPLPTDMAYSNLVISNTNATATIATDITVNGDLNIKPGSALTVGTGGSLSIAGTTTIESDATGTGSFISGSAVSANVQRYIAGHNNAGVAYGWHLLSAPVSSQAISAFHTAGSGDDFYKWSEADALWINRTTSSNDLNPEFETNFETGRGYLIANVNTDTKTFNGSINSANVSVSNLSYTGSNGLSGWHLLGNPFSSALKWNDGNWSLNQVDANAQIWNEANASYNVLMPNDIIPTMNGFFVHASQNNASITMPVLARTHSGQNWYKNSVGTGGIVLTAKDPEGHTAQPTILRFNPMATEGYDPDFDSYFMAGFAPRFYSISQQKEYALNTLPELGEDLVVGLGFIKNGNQNFVLELTENAYNQTVILQDHKTAIFHNMNGSDYAFSSEEGDSPNRFSIHFGTVGINEAPGDETMKIWYNGGQLHGKSTASGTLVVYDALGKMCYHNTVSEQVKQSWSIELKPGVYIAQITSPKGRAQVKFLVQH